MPIEVAASDPNEGWIAIQVRGGRERTAADWLNRVGYAVYLPLRKSRPDEPPAPDGRVLFPGYLFCRYQSPAGFRIVEAPGVIGIVTSGERPARVDDTELEAIRRIVASGFPVGAAAYVAAGDRVRIASGPLQGVEGVVVRHRDRLRVIVSVQMLARAVAVELAERDLHTVPVPRDARRLPLPMLRGRRLDRLREAG